MRHEHNNKGAREDGGIIGMTGDHELLQKWLVSGPELSRLINQFEETFLPEDPEEEGFHHSEAKSYQIQFQTKVKMVVETINKFGNPFMDTFHELVTLDSRNCLDSLVVEKIRNLKDIGKKQYSNYCKAVLEEKTASIHDPIKRNRLHLPKSPLKKTLTKDGVKVQCLKNNAELFGKLFVILQNRDCDMMDLFSHEIQSYPPSLSDAGKLNLPKNKSDIINCIAPEIQDEATPVDCRILDGPAIVHPLKPNTVSTFEDYVNVVFIPYLERQLSTCKRLDVIFHRYLKESLKQALVRKEANVLEVKLVLLLSCLETGLTS